MTKPPLILIAAAALAVLWAMQHARRVDDMPDQETTVIDDVLVTLDPSTYDPAPVEPDTVQTNVRATLDMIAYSEGTGDSYNILFGGGHFDSYADHPRQLFNFTNRRGETLKTTAAGRYQFLARTWDALRDKLALPDFGPESQDTAALELIRQRGALKDAEAGRIAAVMQKCAPIWASLPGAGYAQPERKQGELIAAFTQSGGIVAT